MLFRVGLLPDEPLAAAACFHGEVLPRALALLATLQPDTDLLLVFPPADYRHRGWRTAAVQGLAREHAPVRVNAVESDDEAAIAAVGVYLARAPGITGQYWPLDGTGAGVVY